MIRPTSFRRISPAPRFPDFPDPVDPSLPDAASKDELVHSNDFLDDSGPASAELSFLDYDDLDDRYIPPPVPPQPKLDPVAKGAWLALFCGPGYLFVAILLGWQVPGWAELVSIVAFVTGFVLLVARLGDGPSKRDGPDQGAVV